MLLLAVVLGYSSPIILACARISSTCASTHARAADSPIRRVSYSMTSSSTCCSSGVRLRAVPFSAFVVTPGYRSSIVSLLCGQRHEHHIRLVIGRIPFLRGLGRVPLHPPDLPEPELLVNLWQLSGEAIKGNRPFPDRLPDGQMAISLLAAEDVLKVA